MTISRRRFLHGSAALAALSPRARSAYAAPLPRDAEVVVIGAGAAGIAAARRIAAAGRKVVVLEASDRIGGRCLTDTTSFDVPFDRGARWLYSPETNSAAKLARSVNQELYPAPRGQRIRIGRRNARARRDRGFSRVAGEGQSRDERCQVRHVRCRSVAERYARMEPDGGLRARCLCQRQRPEGSLVAGSGDERAARCAARLPAGCRHADRQARGAVDDCAVHACHAHFMERARRDSRKHHPAH